jgi:hypothetical protein
LNFSLKSSKIPVGLRSQLASVTINFTDNRDYRAVLYSLFQTGKSMQTWNEEEASVDNKGVEKLVDAIKRLTRHLAAPNT